MLLLNNVSGFREGNVVRRPNIEVSIIKFSEPRRQKGEIGPIEGLHKRRLGLAKVDLVLLLFDEINSKVGGFKEVSSRRGRLRGERKFVKVSNRVVSDDIKLIKIQVGA